MSIAQNKGRPMNDQRGAVLLVSLIMLVILTLVGIASIKGLTINQKMASNFREHDVVFQAAESALLKGERSAADYNASFNVLHFQASCSGNNCFTTTCKEGFCFNGTYPCSTDANCDPISKKSKLKADVCTSGAPAGGPLWESDVWTDSARHVAYSVDVAGLTVNTKYIVEFMCYTPTSKDTSDLTDPPPYKGDWSRMYRITALAEGVGNSKRMLQSTFKVAQD